MINRKAIYAMLIFICFHCNTDAMFKKLYHMATGRVDTVRSDYQKRKILAGQVFSRNMHEAKAAEPVSEVSKPTTSWWRSTKTALWRGFTALRDARVENPQIQELCHPSFLSDADSIVGRYFGKYVQESIAYAARLKTLQQIEDNIGNYPERVEEKRQALVDEIGESLKVKKIPYWLDRTFFRMNGGFSVFIKATNKEDMRAPLLKHLKQNIKDEVHTDNGSDWVFKLALYSQYRDKKIKFGGVNLTSTQRHLAENMHHMLHGRFGNYAPAIFTTYMQYRPFSLVLDRLIAIEREFSRKGYHTFVHGQRWHNWLTEHWFSKLWENRTGISTRNYLFPHVRDTRLSAQECEVEREIHKDLLDNGVDYDDPCRKEKRARVHFLNYGLFANSSFPGCCTAGYLVEDSNIGPAYATLEDAFRHNGYEQQYEKYKDDLAALEEKAEQLQPFGNLLVVAVPKKKAHEHVYAAIPGGGKKILTVNGSAVRNVNEVMDILHKNPFALQSHDRWNLNPTDHIEFCLVLTADTLTPKSGVKIVPVNMCDSNKFGTFQKESDRLFGKIKRDIRWQQLPKGFFKRAMDVMHTYF